MAKKRTNAPKRKKKSSKRKPPRLPLTKILISLVLLCAVAILAALVARWLIQPVSHPGRTASLPQRQAPASDTIRSKPLYEVFPERPAIPKPVEKLPPAPGHRPPLVAIIVDDMGYDLNIANQLLSLDVPMTFSMLPYGPFNTDIMTRARARGMDIMLHLPMEPVEYPKVNPGPGALLNDMSADDLIAQLNEDIMQIPGLVGVNNHMGSRISTSPERMRQIFSILKTKGLFYIDSRTTAETVARPSARLLKLPFAERDIFIDHLDNADFIDSQLEALIERARTQGFAVAIAHPHEETVRRLKSFLPRLQSEVTFVSASDLVQAISVAESAQSSRVGG